MENYDYVRRNNGQWLLTLFFPLAILGKVLRWTILKSSLADMGIGHGMAAAIINNPESIMFRSGDTTANANLFFKYMNIFDSGNYEQFEIAISIIYNIGLFIIIYDFIRRNRGVSMLQFTVMVLFVGVLNVYSFTLSKEAFQILFFLMMYPVIRSEISVKSRYLLCFAIMVLMVFATRRYFMLMLAFTILVALYLRFFSDKEYGSISTFLLLFAVVGVVYFLLLYGCKSLNISEYQELYRIRMSARTVTTGIRPVIVSDSLGLFSLNYVITFFRILFPVELLRFGFKHMLYATFQIIISLHIVRCTMNYGLLSPNKRLVTAMFWGFLFCSAAFEPDFGSWSRHESSIFPFLIFAFDNDEEY